MPKKHIITALMLLGVVFSFFNMAQANPYPAGSQQWHNYNAQMQDAARQNSGYSANRHREKIKADMEQMRIERQIKRYRKTPYYGAILFNPPTGDIFSTAGQNSEQKSIERVMNRCKTNCRPEIIKTFSNTCAVIVTATDTMTKSKDEIFVGIDPDERNAAEKAITACEAVHGKKDDKCFYSNFKRKESTICAGYDYGVYSNK